MSYGKAKQPMCHKRCGRQGTWWSMVRELWTCGPCRDSELAKYAKWNEEPLENED